VGGATIVKEVRDQEVKTMTEKDPRRKQRDKPQPWNDKIKH